MATRRNRRRYLSSEVPASALLCGDRSSRHRSRRSCRGPRHRSTDLQRSGLNRIARLVVFDVADKFNIPVDLQAYHCFHEGIDFGNIVGWIKGTLTDTGWPPIAPILDWQPADCEQVREAFTRLLTVDTPHRVLLIYSARAEPAEPSTRRLLSLALKCDWLTCGRFDLKSGADLDGELAPVHLQPSNVEEALQVASWQTPRVRLYVTT